MRRIILACSLAGIFAMPANALDGTRSPNNISPPAVPGIQLRRDAAELLERAAQLRRDAADLLAQVNPGDTTQGVDPLIGTWKLNLEKSKLVGPTPKSWTITYVPEGRNLIATLDAVDAQGGLHKYVFTVNFDGQPHPTTGSPIADSAVYFRIGNMMNMVSFKNGKVVNLGQIQISDKIYTVMEHANGFLVWERQ
jgi:hypothetical protein